MAKQNKDTFLLRHDFFPQIKMLTMEQRGRLLTAIYAHATEEELPEMDELTTLCFGFIRASLDANAKKYYAECEQNRENGRKGGRPKKADGLEENRTVFSGSGGFSSKPEVKHENPIESVSDSDIDSESDSVSVSVSVSESETREEERETFFEIFFFKNFQNPDYEVERFCANYEASGWIRKNGQAAIDRPALARTWTQEDKNAAPRFNADFLAKYRRFYGLVKQTNPALAPIFIHDLELVFIDAERKRLTFRCTRQMAEAVEANVRLFRDNFFDKHFAGWTLHYQTLRI